MKPILLATDFSPASKNAADYAAHLAKAAGTELIIFHALNIPLEGINSVAIEPAYVVKDKHEQSEIFEEAMRLEKTWKTKVQSMQATGFDVDEIENCSRQVDADLVVMGMRKTDPVEWAFGSVVTAFIKRDSFPLLVIPEGSKFIAPKKILLATDLLSRTGFNVLDVLKELASAFSSDIHIVNILTESLQPVDTVAESSGQRLQHLLKGFPHTWHYEETNDVVHGIFKTADEINVQWISVIHHHMGWVKRLFKKSTSRQLAFLSNIPLLVLPEIIINHKK